MSRWHALAGKNAPHDQMAASLFGEVVPSAANYSSALAHVIDFYLRPDMSEELHDLIDCCSEETGRWTEARLIGYIREALSELLSSYFPPGHLLIVACARTKPARVRALSQGQIGYGC
jgi:hypothetical protein